MAYQLNGIESYKDRVSKKGKKYLSCKITGRGWASCWDSKFWPILKKAAQNGTEINIDVSESENVDENGNPYLNIMGAVDPAGGEEGGGEEGTEAGGEAGSEAGETGEEPAPPAKPKQDPAKKPGPAAPARPGPAAPARSGPAAGARENEVPRSAIASDDSLGRALVALSAGMLAWGGVIAKTEADVCAWIKRFENFRTKGIVPEIEK